MQRDLETADIAGRLGVVRLQGLDQHLQLGLQRLVPVRDPDVGHVRASDVISVLPRFQVARPEPVDLELR